MAYSVIEGLRTYASMPKEKQDCYSLSSLTADKVADVLEAAEWVEELHCFSLTHLTLWGLMELAAYRQQALEDLHEKLEAARHAHP